MDDTISRQVAIDSFPEDALVWDISDGYIAPHYVRKILETLPSAEPKIIRCKDCKHWKDSDGIYRRGFDAESKCPLNLKEVYDGTFYCGMAERRTDEPDR